VRDLFALPHGRLGAIFDHRRSEKCHGSANRVGADIMTHLMRTCTDSAGQVNSRPREVDGIDAALGHPEQQQRENSKRIVLACSSTSASPPPPPPPPPHPPPPPI